MQDARWTVHTEVFEGPLDLLLYLVRRDGIDLKRFPVREITEAYLDYLDRMRELHLGVAAEYLVMAATLVWLKSRELLPRPPSVLDEDLEEDPREELVRRLRAYQAYREAADQLDERVQVGREVFVRDPTEIPGAERPVTSPVDAFGLLEVFYELLDREAAPEPSLEVGDSGPQIAACCRAVLSWLDEGGGQGDLGVLLRGLPTKVERVVTFVAVLEMARLCWVDLRQDAHLGPVRVQRTAPAAVDLSLVTGELLQEAG